MLPIAVGAMLYPRVRDWVQTNLNTTLASFGVAAPPAAYTTVPAAMKQTPGSLPEAYGQAAFWLAFAARRADWDAAQNPRLRNTQLELNHIKQSFDDEGAMVLSDVGTLCNWTGYGCPRYGRSDVLDRAITAIQRSSLQPADKEKIVGYLRKNRAGAQWSEWMPLLATAAVGGLGIFAVRKYRSRK